VKRHGAVCFAPNFAAMAYKAQDIPMADYHYDLPQEKIAAQPLANRVDSRLLCCIGQKISDANFSDLPAQLPKNCRLVFNETKVVYARLYMVKAISGKVFELFCLGPADEASDIQSALQCKKQVIWKCLVKGMKRWKQHALVLEEGGLKLEATLVDRNDDFATIHFEWNEEISFAEVLESVGKVPLPPYMQREAEKEDKSRYQTVFAKWEGSVAAPTASLHFDDALLRKLKMAEVSETKLTLHVGAGTFKPVNSESVAEHYMHAEAIDISLSSLKELAFSKERVVAVGTTAMRSMESLYWLGAHLLDTGELLRTVPQWIPYSEGNKPTKEKAIGALIARAERNGQNAIRCQTELIIVPGYLFRVGQGLITNFHQPGSTLLLLVAALIGTSWKDVYQHALKNDYRFLSYGDGSLLIP